MTQILSLAALVAALTFWIRHAGHETASWPATLVKTASTAALALGGLAAGAPLWVVLGLALGSVGDFALARRGKAAFLVGMAAFAAGHLAYAAGFATGAQGGIGPAALILWPLVVVLVAVAWLWLAPRAGGLCWPVRLYGAVIGAMVAASALTGQSLFVTGALVFMASDLILGLRMFVLTAPSAQLFASRLLWPLYWGGQALILAGTLA